GLYPKEAQAMVNTWEKSYFHTDGLRLLYVLPRTVVDEVIPLRIEPTPTQTVRVMAGRVEVLTPAKERRLEQAVANLQSNDPAPKKAAGLECERLGRLKEPVLRRLLVLAASSETRAQLEVLIKGASHTN